MRNDKYVLCDSCGAEYEDKKSLENHVMLCLKKEPDESSKNPKKIGLVHCKETNTGLLFYCKVCEKNFYNDSSLRFHIRRVHFNLKAKVPYFYRKKVNQIWFEKVMNSNKILEVHKTSPNTLVLRTLSENTTIKVNEFDTDVVDLSNMYPTYSPTVFTICDVCDKKVFKQSILKHKKKHEKVKTNG